MIFSMIVLMKAVSASVYSETVKQVETMYERTKEHCHHEFMEMDIVKDESQLKRLLKEIIKNENNVLEKISAYYHPIGFIKIVLHRGREGQQLRLHFWGRKSEKVIQQNFNEGWEPIHNHRWSFSSKVIRGGLAIREYTDLSPQKRFESIVNAAIQSEIERDHNFQIYEVLELPGNRILGKYDINNTLRFAFIGNLTKKKVLSGNAYYTHHTMPHQVKPNPYTSTLLLIDPPAKLASEIFINGEEDFLREVDLTELTQVELQEQIIEFLQAL